MQSCFCLLLDNRLSSSCPLTLHPGTYLASYHNYKQPMFISFLLVVVFFFKLQPIIFHIHCYKMPISLLPVGSRRLLVSIIQRTQFNSIKVKPLISEQFFFPPHIISIIGKFVRITNYQITFQVHRIKIQGQGPALCFNSEITLQALGSSVGASLCLGCFASFPAPCF